MKLFTEYCRQNLDINEFLRTDVKMPSDTFPEKPKTKDVIEFLESNGFKQIKDEFEGDLLEVLTKIASVEYDNPTYIMSEQYSDGHYWIRFFNKGNIDKNSNPIFFMKVTDNGEETKNRMGSSSYAIECETGRIERTNNYDLFKRKLFNIYGWKWF